MPGARRSVAFARRKISTVTGTLARTFANATITANGTAAAPGTTTILPEDFGAVGNGTGDYTSQLQAALNSLNTTKTLSIRSGFVYNHAGVLNWSTPGNIIGPGRLHATVQTTSAFKVTGTGSNQVLGNVEFSSVNTSRGVTTEHMKVLISGTGVTLNGTKVSSSHCVGFFFFGATNCTANDIIVTGSRADAIHCTFGTTGARINRPIVSNAGDDSVACVSYTGDVPNSDIIITNPVVSGGTFARGCTILGGSNIHMTNIDVDGMPCAGLYIGTESAVPFGFNTHNLSNCTVTVKRIANANSNAAVAHGDIFFVCGQSRTVSGVTVTGTDGGGGRGLITSSDSAANWHIGGTCADGTGSINVNVAEFMITPNDGKPLKFQGTNTTINLTNVSY